MKMIMPTITTMETTMVIMTIIMATTIIMRMIILTSIKSYDSSTALLAKKDINCPEENSAPITYHVRSVTSKWSL